MYENLDVMQRTFAIMARYLSDFVISTTNIASRYASCTAWLWMVGLWLCVDLSIVMPDVRAACLGESTATITCTTTNTSTTGVGIDTSIDTTVTVDSGVTVSHTGNVIDFDQGGGSATNAVNNDGAITTTGTFSISGGSGAETIDNRGTITGDIRLRVGADTFTNQLGGMVIGDIRLDGGNDVAINDGTISRDLSGLGNDDMLTNNGNIGRDLIGGSNNDILLNTGTVGRDMREVNGNDQLTNTNIVTRNLNGENGDDTMNNSGTVVQNLNGGAGNDGITNSGSVGGDLNAGNGTNTVTNNASGMITGNLLGGGNDDTIDNAGSVMGTLNAGDGTNTVMNTGTVTLDLLGGADVDNLTNSGTIMRDLLGGAGNDQITNDGDVDGNLDVGTGTNMVTNNASGMIAGNLLGGGNDDTIDNAGSVMGTLNAGDGINMVTNTGTITMDLLGGTGNDDVTNSGSVGGNLDVGDGTNMVMNTGTITGSLLAGTGDDTISLNTGSSIGVALDGGSGTDSLTLLGTGTLDSPVANIETLDSQGDWILNAPAAFVNGATISSGTLALQNTLTANTVIGSGATLMGNGTILGTLTNNGMLSPGNSIGTITITGDYVQNPGTTLEIEVSPTNGLSDQLVISGTAQLGGTLSIVPLGDIPSSNEYTFLSATGDITGTFDEILQPSAFSFDLDFSDPTAVQLSSVSVDFLANALTPNQRATGTYLDQIFSAATPELEANLATLGAIPDITAYQAALDQLNPEFFDAFTGKTFLENYWFNSALGTRRNHCWRQEPEQAPRLQSCGHRFATWSQLDGSTIGRSGGANHISYDAEVFNLAMGGFWAPANGRASLQAAIGYSHDQLSIIDRGTGSSHRATVGVQGRKYVGPFALARLVTGGYKWSESTRTITYSTVNQEATASFNSLIASADVRLEYEAFNTQGWYGLTYGGFGTDHMTTYRFSESYAEGLGLNVDSFDATRYGLFAGGSVKRAFPFTPGGFIVPEVSLSYMAFLDGFDRTITGRLLGAESSGPTLTATGRGPDERLRLEAWLTSQQNPSLDLSVGFLASFLDGTNTQGGALQLVYRFND